MKGEERAGTGARGAPGTLPPLRPGTDARSGPAAAAPARGTLVGPSGARAATGSRARWPRAPWGMRGNPQREEGGVRAPLVSDPRGGRKTPLRARWLCPLTPSARPARGRRLHGRVRARRGGSAPGSGCPALPLPPVPGRRYRGSGRRCCSGSVLLCRRGSSPRYKGAGGGRGRRCRAPGRRRGPFLPGTRLPPGPDGPGTAGEVFAEKQPPAWGDAAAGQLKAPFCFAMEY